MPRDPAIPLLGIYPDKTIVQKDTRTPVFIATLLTMANTQKQPKCPSTDEQIKMWYVCVMEYYSEIITLSEVDKYHMISLIYGI